MGTQTGYYEYFARGAKLPTTALQDVGPLAIAETIMIISIVCIGTRAAEPGARAAARGCILGAGSRRRSAAHAVLQRAIDCAL